MKFEIKSWITGGVLFSAETESLKLAVELAVKGRADLQDADLLNADLQGADLQNAYLRGAYLRHACLRNADLQGADLSRHACLQYADLQNADLRHACLRYADLQGADFQNADLQDADLRHACLRYAYLRGAALRHACLRYAYLQGAYLRYADLQGADFQNADLQNAYLLGADKYKTTPLYLLADQPGKIRAYKLVNINGEGPFHGGIIYEIGKTYSVKNASTSESDHCAAGINLATLDWCIKEWQPSRRILIAEFTAKDIAAIPIGSDGKFRVHKCKIVGEKKLKDVGIA